MDIRPAIDFWGTDSETRRWHELRDNSENENLSDTDISELVLQEDWSSKLRKEHVAKLDLE